MKDVRCFKAQTLDSQKKWIEGYLVKGTFENLNQGPHVLRRFIPDPDLDKLDDFTDYLVDSNTLQIIDKVKSNFNKSGIQKYDSFILYIEDLKQCFLSQHKYKGLPVLPDYCLEGFEIYKDSNLLEKERMFFYILFQFVESLRHWKVDKDLLWTEQGIKSHNDFMEKYKVLIPYMKSYCDRFW